MIREVLQLQAIELARANLKKTVAALAVMVGVLRKTLESRAAELLFADRNVLLYKVQLIEVLVLELEEMA